MEVLLKSNMLVKNCVAKGPIGEADEMQRFCATGSIA